MQRESLTSAVPEDIFDRQSQSMRLRHWVINHKILTAISLLVILVVLTIIVLFFASASPRRPIAPTTQAAYGYVSWLPKLGEATVARPHDTTSPQRGSKAAVGFDSRAVNQKKASAGASSSSYAAAVQRGADSLVRSVVGLGVALKQPPKVVANSIEAVVEAAEVNSTPGPAGHVKITPVAKSSHTPLPPRAVHAKGNFTVPLQHGLSNIHARASNALPLR